MPIWTTISHFYRPLCLTTKDVHELKKREKTHSWEKRKSTKVQLEREKEFKEKNRLIYRQGKKMQGGKEQ